MASKWWNWDVNSGISDSKAYYFSSLDHTSKCPQIVPTKRLLPIWLICKGLIQALGWIQMTLRVLLIDILLLLCYFYKCNFTCI